jgi:hypothetical protein
MSADELREACARASRTVVSDYGDTFPVCEKCGEEPATISPEYRLCRDCDIDEGLANLHCPECQRMTNVYEQNVLGWPREKHAAGCSRAEAGAPGATTEGEKR